jgi:hypothetical protein
MKSRDEIPGANLEGLIRVCRVNFSKQDRRNPRKVDPLFEQHNQIQLGWGSIVSFLLAGRRDYRVNSMYIEYENVAAVDDPVTVPTFSREEGTEYYNELAFSTSRDFLRVPLLIDPQIGIAAGFEDNFTEGVDGNKLTFFTQSQGTVGFHGKPFSAAVNSKIFGVALVATPELADQSRDIVFARSYFDTANQEMKLPSSQVGITWDILFK